MNPRKTAFSASKTSFSGHQDTSKYIQKQHRPLSDTGRLGRPLLPLRKHRRPVGGHRLILPMWAVRRSATASRCRPRPFAFRSHGQCSILFHRTCGRRGRLLHIQAFDDQRIDALLATHRLDDQRAALLDKVYLSVVVQDCRGIDHERDETSTWTDGRRGGTGSPAAPATGQPIGLGAEKLSGWGTAFVRIRDCSYNDPLMSKFIKRFLRLTFDTSASVFTNLGASAIDRQQYKMAVIYVGLAGILTAAKSTAEYYLTPAEQKQAQDALLPLVEKYKGLRPALEALARNEEKHPTLSAAHARELLAIADERDDGQPSIGRVEELIVYVAKWLQDWQAKDDETWQEFSKKHFELATDIRTALSGLSRQMKEGFETQSSQWGNMMAMIKAEMAMMQNSTSIDREIGRAVTYVKHRKFESAIDLLEELRAKDGVSPAQRFVILKNLGHAYANGRSDYAKSASLYLDAHALQPDTEDGLALEAIALLNLGKRDEAFVRAKALLDRFPRSTYGLSAFVRSASDDTPLDDLEARVPEDLRKDVDVAAALAFRSSLSDSTKAEVYARAAVAAKPDNPLNIAFLGEVLLESERQRLAIGLGKTAVVKDRSRIEEAERLLTQAIDSWDSTDRFHLVHLRLCRGLAYTLLGRQKEADQEYLAAHMQGPENVEATMQVALTQIRQRNRDAAIENVRKAAEADFQSRAPVLLAQLLSERNQEGDRVEAVDLLSRFLPIAAEAESWLRATALELLVDLLCSSGEAQRALETIRGQPAGFVRPEVAAALEATAYRNLQDHEREKDAALRAASLLSADTPSEQAPAVAQALERAGLYAQALDVWKSIVKPDHIGPATYGLLRSASRASDDSTIIHFCAELRASGHYSAAVLDVELHALFKYNAVDRARNAVADFVSASIPEADKQTARLMLSVLGIALGETDLIESDPTRLPSVADVTALQGEAVAHVLSWGDNPRLAVDYAYALLRRFPSEKPAFRAMIRSFLFESGKEPFVPSPDVVGPDCAVCYQEEGELEQWRIIEDDHPDLSRHELPRHHELAQEMWGKKVGDTIYLRRGGLQERTAVIRTIVHKTVRRMQECMHDWEHLFPDDTFIVRISLKKNAQGDLDFTPVFKSVDQRQERIASLEHLILTQRLPLIAFAEALDSNVIDAFIHISQYKRWPIHTCFGNVEERESAVSLLRNAKSLVLAPSALATLYITGAYRQLGKPRFQLLASRGSLGELRRMLREAQMQADRGGVLSKLREQYVFIETDPEQLARRRSELTEFLRWVESTTTILDGLDVLEVPADVREQFDDFLGRPFLETVAIAKAKDALLWEDENVPALWAVQQGGVSRVWTQVVIGVMCEPDGVNSEMWHDITCLLLQLRVSFTSIGFPTISFAARKAEWHAWRQPLTAIIDYLVKRDLSFEDRVRCWAVLLLVAWHEAPIDRAVEISRESIERIGLVPGGWFLIRAMGNFAGYLIPDAEKAARLWMIIQDYLDKNAANGLIWH